MVSVLLMLGVEFSHENTPDGCFSLVIQSRAEKQLRGAAKKARCSG
jgi:hypothetical protein